MINNCSVAIYTLGCKVNQYESQAIKEKLIDFGFTIKEFSDCCDIYIVNSCTVTADSDAKTRQICARARRNNTSALIILCGCYSQIQKDTNIADIVFGNNKAEIVEYLYEYINSDDFISSPVKNDDLNEYNEMKITNFDRARAYIKIQDGCDYNCSYCIIPKARGKSRSRKFEDILEEIKRIDDKEIKEIVLTGIEISSVNIIDLLYNIDIMRLNHIKNVRLGSLDPAIINRNFISKYVSYKKVVPHLHISIQSGSDAILKSMRRRYNLETLKRNLNYAVYAIPDLILTADIIVGFPGETYEDFLKTKELIEKYNIYHTHLFPYSKRKGTAAYNYNNQVGKTEKKTRIRELEKINKMNKINIYKKYLNQKFSVIIENHNQNFIYAKTNNYIDVKIKYDEKYSMNHGDLINVKAVTYDDSHMICEITEE